MNDLLTVSIYFLPMVLIVYWYTRRHQARLRADAEARAQALDAGLTEPASLHPVIDASICIGCAACTTVCPEMPGHTVIGIVGGTYGIGGGAIIAPLLVTLWSLPVHTIAGAALFGTFLTSVVGVGFFWLAGSLAGLEGVTPNWTLGLSFGVGGLLGTYTGARLQRFLPARAIEAGLGLVVTGLAGSYLIGSILS
jgi:uncharacterized membrane protein YfcA